jgi:hypothetical protein
MFRVVVLAAILPLCIYPDAPQNTESCSYGTRNYRASVRHIEQGGIGYNQGYTTLQAFLAPDPTQLSILPFVDLRGHVFDDGRFATNVGLGIRALVGCRIYGGNVYYDYRHTKQRHYNQIGLGFETLGARWDLRANGYLVVGPKKSAFYDVHTTSTSAFDTFQGNYALVRETRTSKGKVQFAMSGVNAEAAVHILKSENVDLYAAGGPYYYNYSGKQAIGGEVRLGAQIYEYVTVEAVNSYDNRFHNNAQGSIGINIPLGPRPKILQKFETCSSPCLLAQRLVQDVARQEIIVVDKKRKTKVSEEISPAIDPATGLPYFFVFVDNTSSSNGTYESPYHSLAQAQAGSSPNDIIYLFPGDGTTTGMDSGIVLQANQQLWGSSLPYSIPTSNGRISIPAFSSSAPTITNTNIDTEGNAITLSSNNVIRGITITSAFNDAIYGTDPQSLIVDSCTFENTSTFAIEASFPASASVSLTNNQFLNNVNGISLILNGTSTVVCSNNLFTGQTSVSETPIEIASNNNVITAQIENNILDNNETGGIRFNFQDVTDAELTLRNNLITNNRTGFQSNLASSFVILPNGAIHHCSIVLEDNTFSANTSNALYLHTSGQFATLEVTASSNTMSNIGGSGLVLATPVDTLTLLATDNTIAHCNDNGIAVIAAMNTTTGNITLQGNTITEIGNASNGIAVNQDFTTLNLSLLNNVINSCEGTGILSYAPTGIGLMNLNISGNTISHCDNLSSNASSGLDIEQYINLVGSVDNNTLTDNVGTAVTIGSTLPSPTACLTLTGNVSTTDYLLSNPMDGLFNLSPCDAGSSNAGIINTSGAITPVQSCPDASPCPP